MKHFSWILRIFHIFILYTWIAFIILLPANPVFSIQLYVLLNILFALVDGVNLLSVNELQKYTLI